MQAAMKVGLVGQTYALPRCSSSPGKKTRNRLPKEERKSMVESFVKKYQESNNGKFPSLSLTHKEVGGSFYTVREIVREIIQENKVLCPGNPNSQGLTLDDCVEPSSTEAGGHFSVATNGKSIEEVEKEDIFILSHHQVEDEEMVMIEGGHDSNISIKTYDYKDSYVDCDILDVKKDVAEQSQLRRYKYQGDEKEKFESSVPETMLQTNSETNRSIKSIELASMGNIVPKFTETDSTEDLISVYKEVQPVSSLDGTENRSFSQSEEDFESSLISNFRDSLEQTSQEKEDSIISSSSLETINIFKDEKDEKEDVSSGLFEETHINVVLPSQHSMEEKNCETRTISSSVGDDKLAHEPSPILGVQDFSTSKSVKAKVEVEPMLLTNEICLDEADITSETIPDPSHDRATKSEFGVKIEIKHSSSSDENSSSSLLDEVSSELSEDAYKPQESQETHPVMSAIKGFFAAIVKFFTE